MRFAPASWNMGKREDMKNLKKGASVADRIVERLQRFTEALESGAEIAEKFTCRQIHLDLKASSYDPALVKETRNQLGVSQVVFAQLLGVSAKTVRAWEQGVNPPNPMACRFMDEIRRNPQYWMKRLRESAVAK